MLAEIQREVYGEFIGPLILEHVSSLVAKTVRAGGYRADVYADEAAWTEEALRDLTQEIVTVQLIEERQLDHVMNQARSISDFDALLRRQIRQQLRRRRKRTVVDNLLSRTRDLLAQKPFVAEKVGRRVLYSLTSTDPERRAPTELELRRAAQRAAVIPRIPARGAEARTPVVYSSENLQSHLETVARALPAHFSLTDVRSIFEFLLTDRIASNLSPVWEDNAGQRDVSTAEEAGPLRPKARCVLTSRRSFHRPSVPLLDALSSVQRTVLRGKLSGAADADIAVELGISRPTGIKRKTEALAALSEHLEDLEAAVPHRAASVPADAVLSAVVFLIGIKLVDVANMKDIWRLRRDEFAIAALTAVVVVGLGIEQGIIVAIVLSILLYVRRYCLPHDAVVGWSARGGDR